METAGQPFSELLLAWCSSRPDGIWKPMLLPGAWHAYPEEDGGHRGGHRSYASERTGSKKWNCRLVFQTSNV